jgi:small conductance mechanosensitive channel
VPTTGSARQVYDWSGTAWLAENARRWIATPARILLIVVLAVLVRYLAHRTIRRLTDTTAAGTVPSILRARRLRATALGEGAEQLTARRTQRAEAIGSVLRNCASVVVLGIAVVLVLGELGINLAPILASAGVVGVALGFGAQNLVKDFIAGIGIIPGGPVRRGGTSVDRGGGHRHRGGGRACASPACGTSTAWSGTPATARCCGSATRARATPRWSSTCRSPTTPTWSAAGVSMQEVADVMHAEEEWGAVLLAAPESLGVEQITSEGVFMRLQVRTTNADQWRVGRELRMRLKERFVAEGIRTPPPLLSAAGAPAGAR